MPDYILKADSYDKQSKSWQAAHPFETLKDSHILMPKYDGCHCIIYTTAQAVWSRDMKRVDSMTAQAEELQCILGDGLVVQGEAWYPGRAFPDISGDFRRRKQSDLLFVAYNCLTIDEFETGYSARPYRERLRALDPLCDQDTRYCLPTSYSYPWEHEEDPISFAAQMKDYNQGYDGAMLADPEASWSVGRSRKGELIKVKPNLSLDLRCHDVSIQKGEKTGRDVFVLHVTYNGKSVAVGSGVPHNIYPSDYLGKIVEIEAMGTTPDGSLREPRFKALRPDKEEPDA